MTLAVADQLKGIGRHVCEDCTDPERSYTFILGNLLLLLQFLGKCCFCWGLCTDMFQSAYPKEPFLLLFQNPIYTLVNCQIFVLQCFS